VDAVKSVEEARRRVEDADRKAGDAEKKTERIAQGFVIIR